MAGCGFPDDMDEEGKVCGRAILFLMCRMRKTSESLRVLPVFCTGGSPVVYKPGENRQFVQEEGFWCTQ